MVREFEENRCCRLGKYGKDALLTGSPNHTGPPNPDKRSGKTPNRGGVGKTGPASGFHGEIREKPFKNESGRESFEKRLPA